MLDFAKEMLEKLLISAFSSPLSLTNLRVAAINSMTLIWKKSLEFVGAEYDDLKGRYVEAKKDLKALGEGLNFLSAQVDEMTIY